MRLKVGAPFRLERKTEETPITDLAEQIKKTPVTSVHQAQNTVRSAIFANFCIVLHLSLKDF